MQVSPTLWRLKTAQDFIQERVNIESYLEFDDYEVPSWKCPPQVKIKWTPLAVMGFVGHLIKANLP